MYRVVIAKIFLYQTTSASQGNYEFSTGVGTLADQKKVLKPAGVVHNSKSIKTVVSLLCITFMVWHAW